ncbi:hypothetical protein E4U21_004127 [Claviceps maximensis]|nr:hypothetical protein E4U21_004127 [Claviceps maximensis]
MRLRPAQNGLLFAALLASCGRLIRGAPLTSTADIDPWIDAAAVSPELAGALKARRDEVNESDLTWLLVRSFRPRLPGKPPAPPPLPPSHPAPIPVTPRPAPHPRPKQPRPPHPVTPPRPHPPSPKPGSGPKNNDQNPGRGSGTGDEPKAMETYERAGAEQLDMYKKRVESHEPDTLVVETAAEVAKHPQNKAFLDIYKNDELNIEMQDVRTDDSLELKIIREFTSHEIGFSMKELGHLKQVSVYSAKSQGRLINRGTYDPQGRVILYQDAFKDLNVGQGAKKIPLNEMGMQNFKSVAGDKTKNLRAVFLMDVQNKEFWAITRECYNARRQSFNEILTFEHGSPEFNRYMGSPNFKSKFYSFANHHGSIANKTPDKVVVIPKQHEKSGGKLTVAIVFKDA